MNDVRAEKSAARAAASVIRKSAHRAYGGTGATDALLDFLKPHLGAPIAAYMPIGSEIDCLAAMAVLAKAGPVAVPVVVARGQALKFHRWHPDTEMRAGAFGADIPLVAKPITPRLVIVPLLAFDARGFRLGYGGGFYDRTLETLRAAGPVVAVGFAYSAQQIGKVPTQSTDQKLDAVVTETQTILFGSLFR